MTPSDALSRLRAGLDRDEQIAREAIRGPARLEPDWEVDAYRADHGYHDVRTVSDSSGVCIAPELGRQSDHIARHDPARTLRRVEAIRKVIDRYEFVTGHGPAVDHTRAMDMTTGATAALRDVIEMLASIYPADETEGTH